jgi:hypothetical protein
VYRPPIIFPVSIVRLAARLVRDIYYNERTRKAKESGINTAGATGSGMGAQPPNPQRKECSG